MIPNWENNQYLLLFLIVMYQVLVDKQHLRKNYSPFFVLRTAVVTKPLIFGIFYQHLQFFYLNFVDLCFIDLCGLEKLHQEFLFTFIFGVLNFVFLAISLSTTSRNFLKSAGTVFNLPTSKSSTFVFKLLKLVGTLIYLAMPICQLQLSKQ